MKVKKQIKETSLQKESSDVLRQPPTNWWTSTHEKASVLSRWMALYEAVNIIGDKCEEKNIPLEDISFNPLDIKDYIAATEDIFLRKILKSDYKVDLYFEEDSSEISADIH